MFVKDLRGKSESRNYWRVRVPSWYHWGIMFIKICPCYFNPIPTEVFVLFWYTCRVQTPPLIVYVYLKYTCIGVLTFCKHFANLVFIHFLLNNKLSQYTVRFLQICIFSSDYWNGPQRLSKNVLNVIYLYHKKYIDPPPQYYR